MLAIKKKLYSLQWILKVLLKFVVYVFDMLLDLLMFYILKTNLKKNCYKYLRGKDFIIAYTMMIFEYTETDIVHISSLLFTCSMFRLYCLHMYCLQYTCFHAFCLHVYVFKWLPAYRGSSDHHRVHYVHRRLVVLRIKRRRLPGFKNIYRWWDYRLAFTLLLEL